MRVSFLSVSIILMAFINSAAGQNFYDVNQVNRIEIVFAESNWDSILDSLYAAGQGGRLVGTVVVNGVRFDSVGVRYKGQSSYHPDRIKNPLNIRMDYLVNDQLVDGCYGTLKLSNVYKDPSFVREVLSYETARKYMVAGQANFSNLYINNVLIGLYVSDQDVDKFFTRTHFGSDEGARFKGVLGQNPRPVVWGYFGPDSTNYFDYYELETGTGWSDLIAFLDTFNNWSTAVEKVFAVDRHLWMLAFDLLMVNLDSPINTAQNYYLYEDGSGRFNPIVWDFNENFGAYRMLVGGRMLSLIQMQRLDPFLNVANPNYPVIGRILSNPTYQKMYIAHMKTMIAENFTNGWYLTRAREIQGIIDAHVQADPNKFYTYNDFRNNLTSTVGSGGQAIVGISELVEARIAYLASLPAFQGLAPEVSNITHTPVKVYPNTTVWFTADVTNASLVMLGCRQGMTEAFEKVEMFDDGQHSDGSAGDGVYGVSIPIGAGDIDYFIYAENDMATFFPERAEYEFFTLRLTGGQFIALEQNFPNPFRHSTTITYNLPDRSRVLLKVFDVCGRVVDVLVDEIKEAGTYRVGFAPEHSSGQDGRGLSAGVYLARLTMQPANGDEPIAYRGTVKLVVLR